MMSNLHEDSFSPLDEEGVFTTTVIAPARRLQPDIWVVHRSDAFFPTHTCRILSKLLTRFNISMYFLTAAQKRQK